MYKKIINKVFRGVIDQAESEDEKEVVIYGLEMLLAHIGSAFVLLFIGYMSNSLLGTIIFLLCLNGIRPKAGGYHANTDISCLLQSIFIYLIIVLVNPRITRDYNTILIIITGVAFIVIAVLAPVLSGKSTCSTKEKQKLKKKTVIILLVELAVFIVLYQVDFELYKFAVYSLIIEGVLIIMGKIKYWELNKKSILKGMMNLSLQLAFVFCASRCCNIIYEAEIPNSLKEKLENQE